MYDGILHAEFHVRLLLFFWGGGAGVLWLFLNMRTQL